MTSNVLGDNFSSIVLVDVLGNDRSVVDAARVSFLGTSKGDEKDKKLLFYLMEHHHTTPFEMVEFKFYVKCPLFVARQWFRHRTFSYNEVSRRYTDEKIEFWVPKPEEIREQSYSNKQGSGDILPLSLALEAHDIILANSERAFDDYNTLINLGVSREQARVVLPMGLYTEFIVKGNAHNWMHFLKLRLGNDAQLEIRLYAQCILEMMNEKLPWTMEAFQKFILLKT